MRLQQTSRACLLRSKRIPNDIIVPAMLSVTPHASIATAYPWLPVDKDLVLGVLFWCFNAA